MIETDHYVFTERNHSRAGNKIVVFDRQPYDQTNWRSGPIRNLVNCSFESIHPTSNVTCCRSMESPKDFCQASLVWNSNQDRRCRIRGENLPEFKRPVKLTDEQRIAKNVVAQKRIDDMLFARLYKIDPRIKERKQLEKLDSYLYSIKHLFSGFACGQQDTVYSIRHLFECHTVIRSCYVTKSFYPPTVGYQSHYDRFGNFDNEEILTGLLNRESLFNHTVNIKPIHSIFICQHSIRRLLDEGMFCPTALLCNRSLFWHSTIVQCWMGLLPLFGTKLNAWNKYSYSILRFMFSLYLVITDVPNYY